MLEKLLKIEEHEFLLRYFDKELLDKAEKGRILAFCINYTPKGYETESETNQLLERLGNDFANEIYKIINLNPHWYERFDLSRRFDGGWMGGYNSAGQRGTLSAHRYLIMHLQDSVK